MPISKTATAPAPDLSSWEERRKYQRKPTFLRAVIADARGENVRDCSVLDISDGGAQVDAPATYPVGTEVCLLDVGNQFAYFAKVAWSKEDRCGLSFTVKHGIGMGLPSHLSFLWRLLLEAKLRDVERDIGKGVPAALAFMTEDLTGVQLHFMAQRASGDPRFQDALRRASALLRDEM